MCMNAIELLQRDHAKMKTLLTRATTANGEERREDLLSELRSHLVAHERMEEEVFYPPLRDTPKTHDIVLEGYEEHHVADLILDELLETPADTDVWHAKMKVLQESLEHHIHEEEDDMFKKARKVLSESELEELGTRMEAVREEALGSGD
jgi:hemerythrin superfamily protein